MDAAFASLLGALIGGGIASGSNLAIERNRARRQDTAEAKKRVTNLRRSGRLLVEELGYCRGLIVKAEERRYFTWEPPKRELPSIAWASHREEIAQFGGDDDWGALADAYGELDRLNWLVREVIDEEGWIGEHRGAPWEGPALGPAAEFDRALSSIDRALERCGLLSS